MNTQIDTKFGISFLIVVSIIIVGQLILATGLGSWPLSWPLLPPGILRPETPIAEGFEKFSSEEEFKAYLEEAVLGYAGFGMTGTGARMMEEVGPPSMAMPGKAEMPERVSETTVQVVGIDEPDVLKTDGKEIYFSGQPWSSWQEPRIMNESMIWPPPEPENNIKVIKAFPPAELGIDSEISEAGNLLLSDNMLIIFSDQKIYGYDVSNVKAPQKEWEIELKDRSNLVSARLYQDKIYLITQTRIDTYHPCPIEPLSIEGETLSIKCTDIYHPMANISADVTYTAMVVDPNAGEVKDSVSFVGTSDSSVLYMSENALYAAYSHYGDFIRFFYNFFNEECQDIIPGWVIKDMAKLIEYDISQTAKFTELGIIFEKFQGSLDEDEALRIENELSNRMEDYSREHKRDLEKTGIVKIKLDGFKIVATTNIPGRLLNQFSLDEYQGYLRAATTVSGGWMMAGVGEEANDVYVLDADLNVVGSVKELGVEESIYSVRFLEDKGYVVTFKQIDPFFVLDLSNPRNPSLKGELKIPGYSSYLHPLDKNKILGIGKEGSKVKISLFDVSNPSSPKEMDKYMLDEYWSDVLNTHHAFLMDKKHQIFFLPASQGGYVFSYKDNELKLDKAMSIVNAKRAVYMDDYLYIVGELNIVVLDENSWEKVNEMEF